MFPVHRATLRAMLGHPPHEAPKRGLPLSFLDRLLSLDLIELEASRVDSPKFTWGSQNRNDVTSPQNIFHHFSNSHCSRKALEPYFSSKAMLLNLIRSDKHWEYLSTAQPPCSLLFCLLSRSWPASTPLPS